MGTMALLGLASAPALLLVVLLGSLLAPRRRAPLVRAAGLVVVLLGLVTLVRGLFPHLLHA
jgi:sulfite exporter TauE/SafE